MFRGVGTAYLLASQRRSLPTLLFISGVSLTVAATSLLPSEGGLAFLVTMLDAARLTTALGSESVCSSGIELHSSFIGRRAGSLQPRVAGSHRSSMGAYPRGGIAARKLRCVGSLSIKAAASNRSCASTSSGWVISTAKILVRVLGSCLRCQDCSHSG